MKCEATIDPIHWKYTDEYRQCSHTASILIDEVHLCGQHGGQIALLKLINNGKALRLTKNLTIVKCEASTNPCYWWMGKEHIEFPDCTRGASLNVDGINLCASHAWAIAIQKLILEGEIKYIDGKAPEHMCNLGDRWAKHMRR